MKKKNTDYIAAYVDAYQAMKKQAIKVIKKYGKEIDLRQIVKDMYPDADDDELDDAMIDECYSVFYADNDGYIYDCMIQGVRYNEERKEVEAFLHSSDGDIDEWIPASYINGCEDDVYMTILENCPSD